MTDSSSDVSRTGAAIPLQCQGRSGGFERAQVIFGICRRCRVEQETDPVDARRNFLEQLQPLAGHRWLNIGETGNVAARPRKARDEAAADRIGNVHENDGDGARMLQHRRGGGRAMRKNQVGPQRDEVLGESLHRRRIAGCRPASVDPDVAVLHPPKLLESLPERRDIGLSFPVALGKRHQHADPPHLVALLRTRRKRPHRRRAAEKRDELAPLHIRSHAQETALYRLKRVL